MMAQKLLTLKYAKKICIEHPQMDKEWKSFVKVTISAAFYEKSALSFECNLNPLKPDYK